MRATFMYGAGDGRMIDVPDPTLQQPTDALVRGAGMHLRSDLHPYHSMPADSNGGPAPVRAHIDQLMPDILDGRVEPGKVFDRTVTLEQTPTGTPPWTDVTL